MSKRTVTASANDAGKRLDVFLTKLYPDMPKSEIYKLIRKKDVKVDSARCTPDHRLVEGECISVFAPDEFLTPAKFRYGFEKAGRQLEIVYEDDNIIVCNKPAGLLCHPDAKEYDDTLISRITRRLYENGQYDPDIENSFAPALANRIDRNTSGLVLAAKNSSALSVLNEKIKSREISKHYLCVVIGVPDPREGILTGELVKNEKLNTVTISDRKREGSKNVCTAYRVLDTRDGLSLCEVELLTGRTHQIRAHFASIGCPLLGDGKYGSKRVNDLYGGYKKQCLCSYKVVFSFKEDAGVLNYLKGNTIEISSVWFRDEFYKGGFKNG